MNLTEQEILDIAEQYGQRREDGQFVIHERHILKFAEHIQCETSIYEGKLRIEHMESLMNMRLRDLVEMGV